MVEEILTPEERQPSAPRIMLDDNATNDDVIIEDVPDDDINRSQIIRHTAKENPDIFRSERSSVLKYCKKLKELLTPEEYNFYCIPGSNGKPYLRLENNIEKYDRFINITDTFNKAIDRFMKAVSVMTRTPDNVVRNIIDRANEISSKLSALMSSKVQKTIVDGNVKLVITRGDKREIGKMMNYILKSDREYAAMMENPVYSEMLDNIILYSWDRTILLLDIDIID